MGDVEKKKTKKKGLAGLWGSIRPGEKEKKDDRDDPAPVKGAFVDARSGSSEQVTAPGASGGPGSRAPNNAASAAAAAGGPRGSASSSGTLASTVSEAQGLRRSFVDMRRERKGQDFVPGEQPGSSSVSLSPSNSLRSSGDMGSMIRNLQNARRSTSLLERKLPKPPIDAYDQSRYDDESTDYSVSLGELFHERYLMERVLGRGSFGQVVRAYDTVRRQRVAIKIVKSEKAYFEQAQIEVQMANLIQRFDPDDKHHLMRVFDTFIYRGHQCLVFELLSSSLYDSLFFRKFKGMPINFVRKVAQQILESLKFLASPDVNIIHCDLKPENVLMVIGTGQRSTIKLIDFGSSCRGGEAGNLYIQSRFYRAPEVLLGIHAYTTQIDVWSLGCLLVELLCGNPIFPGQSEEDQIALVIEKRGMPPPEMFKDATKKLLYFEEDGRGGYRVKKNLAGRTVVPNKASIEEFVAQYAVPEKSMSQDEAAKARNLFLDLVNQMLTYDPVKRISPEDALMHAFVTGAGDDSALPDATGAEEGEQTRFGKRLVFRDSGRQAPVPKLARNKLGDEKNNSKSNDGMNRENSSSPSSVGTSGGGRMGSSMSTTGSLSGYDDEQGGSQAGDNTEDWRTTFHISDPLWRSERPSRRQPARPPSVSFNVREVHHRRAACDPQRRAGALPPRMIQVDRQMRVDALLGEVSRVRFNPNGTVALTPETERAARSRTIGTVPANYNYAGEFVSCPPPHKTGAQTRGHGAVVIPNHRAIYG